MYFFYEKKWNTVAIMNHFREDVQDIDSKKSAKRFSQFSRCC